MEFKDPCPSKSDRLKDKGQQTPINATIVGLNSLLSINSIFKTWFPTLYGYKQPQVCSIIPTSFHTKLSGIRQQVSPVAVEVTHALPSISTIINFKDLLLYKCTHSHEFFLAFVTHQCTAVRYWNRYVINLNVHQHLFMGWNKSVHKWINLCQLLECSDFCDNMTQ